MAALSEVNALGQRIWLDNLTRKMLDDGSLARHIASGVSGLTSNPAILLKGMKADAEGHGALSGNTPEARLEALVLPDIRRACDLFLPVFEASSGDDGYVSLELSPKIAFDRDATIGEAVRLFQAVGKPNLMIKVPATPEGISAFEHLISIGCCINVTLIFSLHQVFRVQEAYVRGIRNCADPSRVRSVASIFLSRIDTLIDGLLEPGSPLAGKTGVSVAKLAYQRHLERFRHGFTGTPQKLLWASTGTKNPAYSDLLYVEPLIGADTVNTLPDATLSAFLDHGKAKNTLGEGVDEAMRQIVGLEHAGIDLEAACARLFEEGMSAFDKAYSELLDLAA